MTPQERPAGWVLLLADGTPYRPKGRDGMWYPTLTRATAASTELRERGLTTIPAPVWTRDAWAEEMRRRAEQEPPLEDADR
jgi:hypothetical protein